MQVLVVEQQPTALEFTYLPRRLQAPQRHSPLLFLLRPVLLARTLLLAHAVKVTQTVPLPLHDNLKLTGMLALDLDISARVPFLFPTEPVEQRSPLLFIQNHQFLYVDFLIGIIQKVCVAVYHSHLVVTVPFVQTKLDADVTHDWNVGRDAFSEFSRKVDFAVFFLQCPDCCDLNEVFLVWQALVSDVGQSVGDQFGAYCLLFSQSLEIPQIPFLTGLTDAIGQGNEPPLVIEGECFIKLLKEPSKHQKGNNRGPCPAFTMITMHSHNIMLVLLS